MKIPGLAGRRRARIEIIPLIDIVFFLLAAFVMVSLSMVRNQGIAVNLPRAVTGAPQDRKMSITITVKKDNEIYLDKEKIALGAMKAKLGQLTAKEPDLKVFINGDEEASFGGAVRVLDEVRKMGIAKVAIQTRKESQ